MIKNKAVVNEDTTGNVIQLQAEIRRLKAQLEKFRGAGIVDISPIHSCKSHVQTVCEHVVS